MNQEQIAEVYKQLEDRIKHEFIEKFTGTVHSEQNLMIMRNLLENIIKDTGTVIKKFKWNEETRSVDIDIEPVKPHDWIVLENTLITKEILERPGDENLTPNFPFGPKQGEQ